MVVTFKFIDDDGQTVGSEGLPNAGLRALAVCGDHERKQQGTSQHVDCRFAAARRAIQKTMRSPTEYAADRRNREPAEKKHRILRVAPAEVCQVLVQTTCFKLIYPDEFNLFETQVKVMQSVRDRIP
jgi:hypothetical protein